MVKIAIKRDVVVFIHKVFFLGSNISAMNEIRGDSACILIG